MMGAHFYFEDIIYNGLTQVALGMIGSALYENGITTFRRFCISSSKSSSAPRMRFFKELYQSLKSDLVSLSVIH